MSAVREGVPDGGGSSALATALQHHQAAQLAGLQTTGTASDLARHQCAGLRCAPATTWGLATTPDSLIKGGPLRSGWSGNFLRSLTTLREKLAKTGAKVVRHGRYVTFQVAEVAMPQTPAEILRLIPRLRPLARPTRDERTIMQETCPGTPGDTADVAEFVAGSRQSSNWGA